MPELSTLRRSSDKRIVAGICGGIAQWLGMSPLVVRLAFVALSVLSAAFPGIVVYLVLWLVIPEGLGSGRPRRSGPLVLLVLALAVMFVIIFAIFALPVILLGLVDAVS